MKAAVVTLSDKGFRNEREDKSGELVQMMLKEAGYEVAEYRLLPDEQTQIETVLKELSDEKEMDLILTTGGTGFSQRDCIPEMRRGLQKQCGMRHWLLPPERC